METKHPKTADCLLANDSYRNSQMFINEYDKKYIHVYQQLNKQKPKYSGNV